MRKIRTTPLNIEDRKGRILNFIDAVSRLDWWKFRPQFYEGSSDGRVPPSDASDFPPAIVFRFRDEDSRVVEAIQKAVDEFKGAVEWTLNGHHRKRLGGTNWMICPKVLIDIIRPRCRQFGGFEEVRMSREMPEISRLAYTDCEALTEHVRAALEPFRQQKAAGT